MDKKKKIVIAEDQKILREGLKSLLNSNDKFEVVGEAEDGLSAIKSVKKLSPDLIILDLGMPKMSGMSAIKEIKSQNPETKILVLTVHESEEYILEVFQLGADGYCIKDASRSELFVAIESVLAGKRYISPGISEKVLEGFLEDRKTLKTTSSWDSLTLREKEVLKLVGEGYMSKEIADYLCISDKTVEKHRNNIMKKLDIHTSSGLTAYAIEKELVVKSVTRP
jgi:DNA-binding NarL/FixJ family response regulator